MTPLPKKSKANFKCPYGSRRVSEWLYAPKGWALKVGRNPNRYECIRIVTFDKEEIASGLVQRGIRMVRI